MDSLTQHAPFYMGAPGADLFFDDSRHLPPTPLQAGAITDPIKDFSRVKL